MTSIAARCVVATWLLASCGDSGPAASDARTGDAPPITCGDIGTPCGTGCPTGLECVGTVCAPVRGDCGGFAGAPCDDPSHTCTYPPGETAGVCMTPDEVACVCARDATALSDC